MALAVVAGAAALTALAATAAGVGLGADESHYIAMARRLEDFDGPHTYTPMMDGHYPPGFPAVLAFLPGDPLTSARWLNAALYAANVAAAGMLAWRMSRPAAAPAAGLLTLVGAGMVDAHTRALADPLFVFCVLGCLLAAREGRWGWAGLAAGVALAAKFAGAALLPVGLRGGRRFWAGAAVAAPALVWQAAADGTTRGFGWHPPPAGPLVDAAAGWARQEGVVFAVLVAAVAVAVLWWRPVGVFAAAYAAVLAATMLAVDHSSAFSLPRLLLPLLAVAAAGFAARVWWAALLVAVLLVPSWRNQAAEAAANIRWADRWPHSPTLQAAARLPRHVRVVSNAPDLVYLYAGREADWLPWPTDVYRRRPRPEVDEEIRLVRRAVERGDAAVVWIHGLHESYVPPLARFARGVWAEYDDGTLISVL